MGYRTRNISEHFVTGCEALLVSASEAEGVYDEVRPKKQVEMKRPPTCGGLWYIETCGRPLVARSRRDRRIEVR